MAYYFCYHNNQFMPFFYPPNAPYYPTFSYETPTFPIENQMQVPLPPVTPQSQAPKSNQSLPTVIPEEVAQIPNDAVRNRRKRERNLDRELVSAKKNSESNIINHFFTFFISKDSSETVVQRAIKSVQKIDPSQAHIEKVTTIFYNIIRLINMKRGRKYINKSLLCGYFTKEWLLEFIDNIDNLDQISVTDIAKVLRKCLYNFINEVSLTSILTSKRITKHSKQVHLLKRRKILNFMNTQREQQ